MNAIDPIDLSIEFVKAQVDPGGGGGAGGGAAAQTGDFYVWAILAIVFVGIIAFCMFKLSRAYNNNSMRSASHASVSRNSLVSPNVILSSIMMIVALIGLIVSLNASTSTAFANSQKNSIDFKPDKIQVTINEETGEATCDPFEFVNNTSDTYIFKNSELLLSEDAKMVSTEEDWDLTLNAIGLNSYLFDGQPGPYNIDLDNIKPFNPGTTSAATLNFNKIDIDIAQKLIGKKVFTLTLTPYQNIVNIPEASSFTFDNKPHTGVESGEDYTLTGTSIATDADTYHVTASLEEGMIWSDRTTEDKNFEWTIAPFNVVLEFDVGTEGYSVQYGDVWPASEEEVKVISKQELPEDFAKIFASGISIGHSYEPGVSQADSQITVSIVKPETNKNYTTNYSDTAILNVLKRELKIDWDEDTCTVTYDAKEHWPDYELSGVYQEKKPQINLTAKNITTGQTETPINVGQYEITASLSDSPINGNYQLVPDAEHPLTCVLTINEVPQASAYWKTEGTTLYLSPTEAEGFTKDEDILKGFGSPEEAPWHESLDSITKVEILEGEGNAKIVPSKMTYLFAGLSQLENMTGLSYIDTSVVGNMSHLFDGDEALKSLDLSSFNTSQATNMSSMFLDTYKLENIALSDNFTTSFNVDFSSMFSDCGSQTTSGVTITNFKNSIKTINAETMSNMFYHAKFASADFTGFSTAKVTNFSSMFQDFKQQNSTDLDLSSFCNAAATNVESMFADCANLTTIYANPAIWQRSKTYSGSNTFNGCYALVGTNKDESYSLHHGQDTTYDSSDYAYICESESKPGLFTPLPEPTAYWGLRDNNTTLYLCATPTQNADTEDPDILKGYGGGKKTPWNNALETITQVIVEPGKNGKQLIPEDMSALFRNLYNCANITGLINIYTSNVISMDGLFNNCYKLTELDLSSFDTSNLTQIYSMFENCYELTSIDLTNASNKSILIIMSMFANCSKLTAVYVNPKKWTTEKARSIIGTTCFTGCDKLAGYNIKGNHHTSLTDDPQEYAKSKYACVDIGINNRGLFSDGTPKAYYGLSEDSKTLYMSPVHSSNAIIPCEDILIGMQHGTPWKYYQSIITKVIVLTGANGECLSPVSTFFLFSDLYNCLDISGLQNINTINVTDMSGMFAHCESLKSLDLSSFKTDKVKKMDVMFDRCYLLESLVFTISNNSLEDLDGMFAECGKLKAIYADSTKWKTKTYINTTSTFKNCSQLVGTSKDGHTTAYSDNPDLYKDGLYARVDVDDNNRGLFTDVSRKPTQNSTKLTVDNSSEENTKLVNNLNNEEEQPLSEPETPANDSDENKNDKAIINKDDDNKEAVIVEDDDDDDDDK